MSKKPEYCTMIDWEQIFKDGKVKLYQVPELPMRKVVEGKTTYEYTDMRLLNNTAKMVVSEIITAIAGNKTYCEGERPAIRFEVTDRTDDEEVRIVSEILMALRYKISKKWKGCVSGSLLIDGHSSKVAEDGTRQEIFEIRKSHAETIFEYAHKGNTVNLSYDAIMQALCDAEWEEKAFDKEDERV